MNGCWTLGIDKIDRDFRTFQQLLESSIRLYPATVPGNFELDLQAAGEIGDPFFGLNIAELRRWDTCHLWFGRRFDASLPPGAAFLCFEGIDCYAEVFLNGISLGTSDNALIEHEFPIGAAWREGENEVLVHIRPALPEAGKYEYPPGVGANRANYESLHVRKPPHAFGWDILPRALSGGLWRPVLLIVRPPERLASLFLQTIDVDANTARLALHYHNRLGNPESIYELAIEGVCGDSRFLERSRVLFEAGRLAFEVKNPVRWWPRNRGVPALYEVAVSLFKDGVEIDRATWRHGIRTVTLDRTSITDSAGNGEFCFQVNGEKCFVLGTNWVPADAFHSRDAARIPRLLELAEEIGCNLIRCWGGNVYENNLFYDLCDEKGFLVWQDFAMGCAVYPQDEAFKNRIAEEARIVTQRLREHACLALWAGDNECDQAYKWYELGDPNHNALTRQVLPQVVRSHDPGRVYLPSSPFIDPIAYRAGEQFLPENHLWGPRDGFKSSYYKEALCHFASEIGYHGCPSPASIRRFISPEKLWPPGNDEWLLHATSPVPGVNLYDFRIELMRKQVCEFFGASSDNLEDFSLQSQCVQAEAFKFFVESFRYKKWRRTGIVWWNLCDGWPQFSDAVVDYYFEKKLAFDDIRRSQQPLCLMVREPSDWKHELAACNDTRHDREIHYTVRDASDDSVLVEGRGVALADAVTVLDSFPAYGAKQRFLEIEWRGETIQGTNHYLAGPPPFDFGAYKKWRLRKDDSPQKPIG